MRVLKKGIKILCPKCNRTMAVANKDIHQGDRLEVSSFEDIEGQLKFHAKMSCPFDGSGYGRSSALMGCEIFTEEGWR